MYFLQTYLVIDSRDTGIHNQIQDLSSLRFTKNLFHLKLTFSNVLVYKMI